MVLLSAAGWFSTPRLFGAETNYLDGARDFSDLVQRLEAESSDRIQRDKNGAVVSISAGWVNDDNMALICREASIRELTVGGLRLTDGGFAAVGQMTNLTSLTCLSVSRRNAMPTIAKLPQLRQLHFVCSSLKPADLPFLVQMTNLEELRLVSAWTLGTNGLAAMTNLTRLKKLSFYAGAYNEGIVAALHLEGPDIEAWRDAQPNPFLAEVASLTNLTSLEELDLGVNDFGIEQLRPLAYAPQLKRLTVWNYSGTRLGKDSPEILDGFPKLESADLAGKEWKRKP